MGRCRELLAEILPILEREVAVLDMRPEVRNSTTYRTKTELVGKIKAELGHKGTIADKAVAPELCGDAAGYVVFRHPSTKHVVGTVGNHMGLSGDVVPKLYKKGTTGMRVVSAVVHKSGGIADEDGNRHGFEDLEMLTVGLTVLSVESAAGLTFVEKEGKRKPTARPKTEASDAPTNDAVTV